ncbi:hypothetical protein V6N11_036743 [Hibiscus sabdariffa]|uniref:Secreted protein n=1 Tax=Hibiscus sabdariffa TaxID=183260 RepID=A0ABR2RB79_9ROSI
MQACIFHYMVMTYACWSWNAAAVCKFNNISVQFSNNKVSLLVMLKEMLLSTWIPCVLMQPEMRLSPERLGGQSHEVGGYDHIRIDPFITSNHSAPVVHRIMFA